MTTYLVNIVRTVEFEFWDTIDIPDGVVSKGKAAIRDYINDVVDEYDMDREVTNNQITFEEDDW